ncbi:MAG: hypothetical protein FWG39_02945 [Alphaproteobacteria bacterium]|nr:hypothetical protein [Alphaproteobacteria bacterium]
MSAMGKYFKLAVGILTVTLVGFIFFMSMRPTALEEGDLRSWRGTGESRRVAAVEILTGSAENLGLMVACIDRVAALPDSYKMKVRDAAALCAAGIALRENAK